ncbi:MAG: FtsW/RodA/SpoVE family cell cycle protein [Clostridia bacterium]|nr:FtsW/RodA/SpoVE family cell cycle protein [Clostridia bacterium]
MKKKYCSDGAGGRRNLQKRTGKEFKTDGYGGKSLKSWFYGSKILLICALILSAIGIVTIFVTVSVSELSSCRGLSKIFVQLGAAASGAVLMLLIAKLPLGFVYKRLWWCCLILSVSLLLLTLKYGTGPSGTKSWLTVPGISLQLQTSEFVKLLFIISFTGHLKLIGEKINHPLAVLSLLVHVGVIAGIVVLQHDLGSALVYLFIAVFMCFSAGLSVWYFAGGGALCLAGFPLIWRFLTEYQKQRIIVGLNPELDPLGYGYQVILSKNAIISGFPWGSQWLSLTYSPKTPAAHTDMIFSVMAEQFGIIAILAVFILYAVIVFRLLQMGRKCGRTGAEICAGVAAIFIVQATENIGMCMGLLPVIGVTLPFLSYGGSSVLSLFLGLGIAVSAVRRDTLQ